MRNLTPAISLSLSESKKLLALDNLAFLEEIKICLIRRQKLEGAVADRVEDLLAYNEVAKDRFDTLFHVGEFLETLLRTPHTQELVPQSIVDRFVERSNKPTDRIRTLFYKLLGPERRPTDIAESAKIINPELTIRYKNEFLQALEDIKAGREQSYPQREPREREQEKRRVAALEKWVRETPRRLAQQKIADVTDRICTK